MEEIKLRRWALKSKPNFFGGPPSAMTIEYQFLFLQMTPALHYLHWNLSRVGVFLSWNVWGSDNRTRIRRPAVMFLPTWNHGKEKRPTSTTAIDREKMKTRKTSHQLLRFELWQNTTENDPPNTGRQKEELQETVLKLLLLFAMNQTMIVQHYIDATSWYLLQTRTQKSLQNRFTKRI